MNKIEGLVLKRLMEGMKWNLPVLNTTAPRVNGGKKLSKPEKLNLIRPMSVKLDSSLCSTRSDVQLN